jgi:hypothetical protein
MKKPFLTASTLSGLMLFSKSQGQVIEAPLQKKMVSHPEIRHRKLGDFDQVL